MSVFFLDPSDFHCDQKQLNIFQDVFYVLQKKESQAGLEQNEDE